MKNPASRFKQSELLPVQWDEIEPLFLLGARSIRSIGNQFGVSHVAILKHAKRKGWTRGSSPEAVAQTEKVQAHLLVTTPVTNA